MVIAKLSLCVLLCNSGGYGVCLGGLCVGLSVFKESSRVEIVSLVDNVVDFMSSNCNSDVVSLWKWFGKGQGEEFAQTHKLMPVAEHGFSMLIRVFTDDDSMCRSVLFDTGVSCDGVVVNAKRMGIDLREVDVIVLSHGHYDHFGGLQAAVEVINKPGLPVIMHENMFMPHGTAYGSCAVRAHPVFPEPEQLRRAKIINTKEPCLVANQSVLVTGEVPRRTSFERGCGLNRVLRDGVWVSDRWVLDDRALVVNLVGRGLVVVLGCAHAGVINTVRYAQEVTGVNAVYGVIGGFHLGGLENEQLISQTLLELKQINPKLIVPCHCTGWRANYALAKLFPQAYIPNSVGNLYQLTGNKT
ncbi:MAG: MBL fold metallo-hydrolase [Nitrososphaerota archaeon]|nr:MBL fold metallo-hydrolase [Nitrososphaerota archaeon]